MRYLVSILRIFVLVAVVLGVISFSDVNKVKAEIDICGGTDTYWEYGGPGGGKFHIRNSGKLIDEAGTNARFISDDGRCNFFISGAGVLPDEPTWVIIEGGSGVEVKAEGTIELGASRLIITEGAKLTHEALIPGIDHDFNVDTNELTPAGAKKKVDLKFYYITLEDHARIDVSGKGYPGGNKDHYKGYGPGGGTGGNIGDISGGGHGGNGCVIYDETYGCKKVGGIIYGSENTPAPGSGGGYSKAWGKNGGAGGGSIKLYAIQFDMDYDSQVFISADGGDGGSVDDRKEGRVTSGGGSGGSILIKVTDKLTTPTDDSYGHPTARGEQYAPMPYGENGIVKIYECDLEHVDDCSLILDINTVHFGEFIEAGAGRNLDESGNIFGGAGGRIRVDYGIVMGESCDIKSGDVIPASCELKDVTVSGTEINMGKVKVKPGGMSRVPWEKCADEGDSTCDSKRHFASLMLNEHAVLTHEAITIGDMAGADASSSLAGQTTGTTRWKKVDIDVTGDINLSGSSKIDVTGKGYPGGGGGKIDTSNGYGPGFGTKSSNDFGSNSFASGAGYGGEGGPGQGKSAYLGGITYNLGAGEYGSGGGGATSTGKDVWTNRHWVYAGGGAGGGFIKLTFTGNLTLSVDSSIVANGANGSPRTGDASYVVVGGGGSGGTIQLCASSSSIINTSAGVPISTNGGKTEGQDNLALLPSSKTFQIFANGGNNSDYIAHPDPYGGGGGGRIDFTCSAGGTVPSKVIKSKKVEVIVMWSERGIDKSVKLYTVLRNLVTK